MKKFNEVIQIEISVDNIAQQLLKTFEGSKFAHADMLTETIIATALKGDTINMIYNNLNGYTNEIDFEVGQDVFCKQEYYANVEGPIQDGVQTYVRKEIPFGKSVIVEINIYDRKEKVKIEYDYMNDKGVVSKKQTWVKHLKLEAIVD